MKPLLFVLTLLLAGPALAGREVPGRLSDQEFWRLVTTFSETGGHFPSDNFVSNEIEYQVPIPRLQRTIKPGGVYVGVGPDQNFTYIAALRPTLAFIVDIRRQNLLQHLMYKALFELAPTRADFVSLLFARAKPPGLARNASAAQLLAAFLEVPEDAALGERAARDVVHRLTATHGFGLSQIDARVVSDLHGVFQRLGPDIAYANARTFSFNGFPGFADLMTRTDEAGVNHAYLADEGRYRTIREMHQRNRIIPIVGNFGGPTALRAVGDYARQHRATVRTLYTSNVEQYLFRDNIWEAYYANVASMPLDASSTFIRAFFPTTTLGGTLILPPDPGSFRPGRPGQGGFVPSSSLLSPVQDTLAAVRAGTVRSYYDVIGLSK